MENNQFRFKYKSTIWRSCSCIAANYGWTSFAIGYWEKTRRAWHVFHQSCPRTALHDWDALASKWSSKGNLQPPHLSQNSEWSFLWRQSRYPVLACSSSKKWYDPHVTHHTPELDPGAKPALWASAPTLPRRSFQRRRTSWIGWSWKQHPRPCRGSPGWKSYKDIFLDSCCRGKGRSISKQSTISFGENVSETILLLFICCRVNYIALQAKSCSCLTSFALVFSPSFCILSLRIPWFVLSKSPTFT